MSGTVDESDKKLPASKLSISSFSIILSISSRPSSTEKYDRDVAFFPLLFRYFWKSSSCLVWLINFMKYSKIFITGHFFSCHEIDRFKELKDLRLCNFFFLSIAVLLALFVIWAITFPFLAPSVLIVVSKQQLSVCYRLNAAELQH